MHSCTIYIWLESRFTNNKAINLSVQSHNEGVFWHRKEHNKQLLNGVLAALLQEDFSSCDFASWQSMFSPRSYCISTRPQWHSSCWKPAQCTGRSMQTQTWDGDGNTVMWLVEVTNRTYEASVGPCIETIDQNLSEFQTCQVQQIDTNIFSV